MFYLHVSRFSAANIYCINFSNSSNLSWETFVSSKNFTYYKGAVLFQLTKTNQFCWMLQQHRGHILKVYISSWLLHELVLGSSSIWFVATSLTKFCKRYDASLMSGNLFIRHEAGSVLKLDLHILAIPVNFFVAYTSNSF